MLILKKCTHLFEITENHLLYMEIVGISKVVRGVEGVCVWRKWVCVYIKFRVDTEQERKNYAKRALEKQWKHENGSKKKIRKINRVQIFVDFYTNY